MLLVFQLVGRLSTSPRALKHATSTPNPQQNFKKLNGSTDNFRGFPSSMIEGSYDLTASGCTATTASLFATGKPPNQIRPARSTHQFTVTVSPDQAAAEGPDVEAIIKGFTVAAAK